MWKLFRRPEPEPEPLSPEAEARLKEIGERFAKGLPGVLLALGGESTNHDTPEIRQVLQGFAETYGRCPFKVKDWVTRRGGTHGHGQGWPHLVIEVAATPHRNFYLDGDVSPDRDPDYGARYDMRVLHQNSKGEVHAHWVESWLFEPISDFAEVEGAV